MKGVALVAVASGGVVGCFGLALLGFGLYLSYVGLERGRALRAAAAEGSLAALRDAQGIA
jgi:hypothetical protein